MAPLEQFSIVLDNGKTVYHPGDQVKGRILLRVSASFSIRRVVVGFYGQGYVTHRSGRTRYHYTQPYFAQQCLAYDINNEAAHQRFGGNFFSGEYWFPFTFTLPPYNLPTSYHDSQGSVRYWLDAVIERPMWFNKKTVVAIFVVEPVDVNTPQLQQCQTKQEEQGICCCCVKGGKVNVSGKINKSGFYPGEVIQAKFYVENQSNREVTYTEMVLVQKLKKKYGEDSSDFTTTRNTITAITGRAVPRGQEADIGGLSMAVPSSLPPSTSLEDSIISVSYVVELIAHVKGTCVCSSSVEFPITIGFRPTTVGSDWSRMVLQAIVQLVNEQLEQEADGGQVNQGGDDGRYDDRAMLMA